MRFWDYIDELENEKEGILSAIENTLFSGKLILGDQVERFENDFSLYSDCSYGVGVNSATDALFIALKAIGVGVGDEVISVANTAVPTISAICATGAKPVFADIDPNTFLIDINSLQKCITKKTKCIIPVHLFGQCANMKKIIPIAKAHNIYVVEDCAQSHGSKLDGKACGSFGIASAYSFYPTKILGTYGDGGMICTSSIDIAKKSRSLRYYGMKERYYAEELGYNSRLDELQAAILNVKFKNISSYIRQRQEIAKDYQKNLDGSGLTLPEIAKDSTHSYYMYVVRHPKRDFILNFLKKRGISLNISYPWPIHTMNGFKYLGYKNGDLPETEKASKEIFSLPIYPRFPKEQQFKLIEILKTALSKA